MTTAKLFANGRSQAVRLPKEFRFEGTEVYAKKIGKIVVLVPMDDPFASLLDSLNGFSDDYMEERNQPSQPERKGF